MHKSIIFITLVFLSLSSYADNTTIGIGTNINQAKQMLDIAKYQRTQLSMETNSVDTRLEFWNIDDGVLIILYNIKSEKIESISYHLTGGGPKAYRKSFDLNVKEYDTKTKEMILIMNKG